jgi:monoamine oxidase
LFHRLRRLVFEIRAARAQGCTTPQQVASWIAVNTMDRRAFNRGLLGTMGALAVGCSDDGAADGGETGDTTSSTGNTDASTSTTPDTTDATADASSGSSTDTDGPGPISVAVIGGGMAGLHCAYRLREAGVDVTIYEASERTGGRMFTARGMFADDQVAELGGEFIDSVHLTLIDLADELGIQLDDRDMALGPDVARDTWWIGDMAVPDETVVMQFSAVADLMADLVVMADSDDDVYAELDAISLEQWLADNVPIDTYPELNAILNIAYRGEYGLETSEQSVLNMLYLIGSDTPDEFRIFGVSDELYHTHLGNDTFTTMLADALSDRIQTNLRLVAVRDGDAGRFVLTFEGPRSPVEVEADHVVFALPFTKLREVDLQNLTLTDEKRTIIAELGYGTNAKVMGGFTSRPWYSDHAASGSVVTDLPAQQFWDTSVGQEGSSGIVTNYLGGEQGVASGEGEAEAWFTDVAVPALEEIYPGSAAAYVPDSAVRMHWPSHPHTLGSYACYRPGQWAFFGLEGAREGNLHFCGEHTSLDYQGYMEGAAETGMLTATAILGDLGLKMSKAHARMAAKKLVRPQPAVHGRLGLRPRWSERRRTIVAASRR